MGRSESLNCVITAMSYTNDRPPSAPFSLDSPASYVQGLTRLFHQVQLLDEHHKAILMQPVASSYAGLQKETRIATEQRLRHASEFFASVVLTFVIRDLAQLLDKYVKKCEKWLAE